LPLEKLESALAAWFKHARESNASIDGTHLKEEALHMATHPGTAIFSASNGWINRFKRSHNIFYRTLSCESMGVDPETVEYWKNL
jgi:centromere protein B